MGTSTISISALSVALSSIPAELVIIPLCTIRLNMMLSEKGPIEVATLIYTERGIFGFFTASIYGIISQMLASTIKFFIYQKLKKLTKSDQKRWFLNCCLGALSGIIGSFVLSPIDRMKVLKQAGELSFSNVISEPWKGFSGTITKNIILYGALFSMTDTIKSQVNDPVLIALLLSISINILLQPIEFIRSKMMASREIHHTGITNYYQGYVFSVIISFLSNLVSNFINPIIFKKLLKKIDCNDTKLYISAKILR